MRTLVIASALALAGCSATNVSALVEQLAKDPAANCIMVGTPYGSVTLARGTPSVSVNVAAGSCTITGSGVTGIQVPMTSVTVSPSKP